MVSNPSEKGLHLRSPLGGEPTEMVSLSLGWYQPRSGPPFSCCLGWPLVLCFVFRFCWGVTNKSEGFTLKGDTARGLFGLFIWVNITQH